MSTPSVFVVSFRRGGSNHPALVAGGSTTLIQFAHDGEGGTHYLYEFADADAAAGYAELVKAQTFPDLLSALDAFEEATDA